VDSQERSLLCGHCGYASVRYARFCTKCGASIESSPDDASARRAVRTSREGILLAPARCTATKQPFAIRFEQWNRGIWQARAAFAISEQQLCNPSFSSNEITSSASVSSTYPGCPHCGTDPRKTFAGISFVKCSCGKLACSSGIIGAENLCPWCGRVGALARHGTIPVLGMKDR
jgi:hypothetical protein